MDKNEWRISWCDTHYGFLAFYVWHKAPLMLGILPQRWSTYRLWIKFPLDNPRYLMNDGYLYLQDSCAHECMLRWWYQYVQDIAFMLIGKYLIVEYPCIHYKWTESYDCSMINLKCMWCVSTSTNRCWQFAILFWSCKIVAFSWSEIQLDHRGCKVLHIVAQKTKQFHVYGCDPASRIICSK
jgi:hypothetical protein